MLDVNFGAVGMVQGQGNTEAAGRPVKPIVMSIFYQSLSSPLQEAGAANAEVWEQKMDELNKALRAAEMERQAACDMAALRIAPEEVSQMRAELQVSCWRAAVIAVRRKRPLSQPK